MELYVLEEGNGLPSSHFESFAVLSYLKFKSIEKIKIHSTYFQPSLPYLKHDGEIIKGAIPIIKYLEIEFGGTLNDDHLPYLALLQDLKECLTFYLYCHSNWTISTEKIPLLYYYLHLKEYPDELYFHYSKKLKNILNSFSILLMKNTHNNLEYVNGKYPGIIDPLLFSYLSFLYFTSLPSPSFFEIFITYPNLVEYVKKYSKKLFPVFTFQPQKSIKYSFENHLLIKQSNQTSIRAFSVSSVLLLLGSTYLHYYIKKRGSEE